MHLEGEEDCPIAELEAEGIRCAGPMRYNIDVGLSGDALWAKGTIAQPVELQCVVCLDRFVQEITVPGFAIHQEVSGPEVVDLTPRIREDILLNLPAHPHCDADGKHECKRPRPMQSPTEDGEPDAAKREHDWGALDQLKLRK